MLRSHDMNTVRTRRLLFVLLSILVLLGGFVSHPLWRPTLVIAAEKSQEELDALKKTIAELEAKISDLQKEKNSLASTIKYLDSKILLNEKQIEQTQREIAVLEAQIEDLDQRIAGLEVSLKELSAQLIERIQQQYKYGGSDQTSLLLATTGFTDFFKEYKYISQTRAHSQNLLLSTEQKRQDYDAEKHKKEQTQSEVQRLQAKLEGQQLDLERQKIDKQKLLQLTQNDERVYQQKLADAQAEFQAIQSIIAGGGTETEVREVKTGDGIASIIAGPSTCSTGAHLHFEVVKNGAHVNPASYLKSADITWYDDSFGFSGSWEWPVHNPALISQGYGMTSFARSGFYGGGPHTGIDMNSKTKSSWGVRAVSDGTLYRGSIRCGKGNLRYVRVKHSNELSSYYLHVNY